MIKIQVRAAEVFHEMARTAREGLSVYEAKLYTRSILMKESFEIKDIQKVINELFDT